jgi:hypothetical protein
MYKKSNKTPSLATGNRKPVPALMIPPVKKNPWVQVTHTTRLVVGWAMPTKNLPTNVLFCAFENYDLVFVSDFDIRISDFFVESRATNLPAYKAPKNLNPNSKLNI